jgi:U3 small nucleolar RNA-associated protein 18
MIQSLQFHPTAPVLLTAGLDKTLRLFQIDGKLNPKIQSVYIKDLPIYSANLTADGTEVLLSGRRPYFYSVNLETGNTDRIYGIRGRDDTSLEKSFVSPCNDLLVFPGHNGHISLLSRQTKQWIGDLKMNAAVRSIDFSKDGQFMYSFGDNGEVYVWDLKMRKCLYQFMDHGYIGGGCLAVSNNNDNVATG